MSSASKLFTYLFYMRRKYDVSTTFMTIDKLRQRLLHVWWGFERSLIDDAVDQWPTRLLACARTNMVVILIYFETVGLFSLYLMNFMFHTTLDAAGNIVGVHYKSMKCDVSLSQGKVSTLFRCDEHIFHVCVKAFFLLTAVQKLFKKLSSSWDGRPWPLYQSRNCPLLNPV